MLLAKFKIEAKPIGVKQFLSCLENKNLIKF